MTKVRSVGYGWRTQRHVYVLHLHLQTAASASQTTIWCAVLLNQPPQTGKSSIDDEPLLPTRVDAAVSAAAASVEQGGGIGGGGGGGIAVQQQGSWPAGTGTAPGSNQVSSVPMAPADECVNHSLQCLSCLFCLSSPFPLPSVLCAFSRHPHPPYMRLNCAAYAFVVFTQLNRATRECGAAAG